MFFRRCIFKSSDFLVFLGALNKKTAFSLQTFRSLITNIQYLRLSLVTGGLVNFRQSSVYCVNYDITTFAQTSLFRTLREIVGRLECDVQEVTA